ncbi:hypothetical protein SprV_0100430100 [Sparganum proliferum]
MSTIFRLQHARAANAHSAHEPVSLDTFGPNAPSTRRLPLLPLSLLPQTPRLSTPVTANHTTAVPTPASIAAASITTNTTSRALPTDGTESDVPPTSNITNTPPPAMWTLFIPVPIAIAHPTHTST